MNHLRAMLENALDHGILYLVYLEQDPKSILIVSARLRQKSGTRFTVIMPNGEVVGDSHDNPAFMKSCQPS